MFSNREQTKKVYNIKWKIVMKVKDTGKNILKKAIDVFNKTTNLNAELIYAKTYEEPFYRALIHITFDDKDWRFVAKIKNNLTRTTLGAIVHQLDLFRKEKQLLVTRYVTPNMADQLREMDIPFIDTAGNAFLNEPPLYIFIKGNRPTQLYRPEHQTRAFQPTGLQVVFALLCNPELEDAPMREIAKKAKAALGTVGWVMRDLKQMGFIIDMGRRGRCLMKMNKKKLLERWVTAYPEKLRPKQLIGRYRAKAFDWWEHAELDNFNAFWGGEIAAAKLTKYLKPEIVTIYITQPIEKLLLNYKIKNDPDGNIEILEAFWNFDFDWGHNDLVNPVLIYADLLATGDPRNIETARMIYEQELIGFIRED